MKSRGVVLGHELCYQIDMRLGRLSLSDNFKTARRSISSPKLGFASHSAFQHGRVQKVVEGYRKKLEVLVGSRIPKDCGQEFSFCALGVRVNKFSFRSSLSFTFLF